MAFNQLNRPGSFKRSRDEIQLSCSTTNIQDKESRPLKRSQSPTSTSPSSLYSLPTKSNSSHSVTSNPPKTPEKSKTGSTRHTVGKRNKLLTSFKRAFSSKNVYQSPVSDNEDSKSNHSSLTTSSQASPLSDSQFNFYTPPSPTFDVSPLRIHKNEHVCRDLKFQDDNVNDLHLSDLSIDSSPHTTGKESHPIFHIPEIVSKIISFVDSAPYLPHEESPIRRRPLSYQHALLIYKDERKAQSVWKEACESSIQNNGNPASTYTQNSIKNNLHSCLLVNKLWYNITSEIASNKLFFTDEKKWLNFVSNTSSAFSSASSSQSLTPIKKPRRVVSNTSLFIMHKITKAKQDDLEIIAPSISGNLEWIEMYICPKIIPTPIMLQGSLLKKLILPGSKVVDDHFLKTVAANCPKLEILDLRACELVSDQGICLIAQNCPKLTNLNLGRHSNGHLITDDSLAVLSRNTKLETLGMAGCAISDRGLWDLAFNCSDSITRLSLNNCYFLTDQSIPRMLRHGYLNKLAVLEIRKILNITNFEPLVIFKKIKELNGQNVLIEGCEILEFRMREEEWKYEMKRSARILNDVLSWANDDNDGDVPHSQLVMNRNVML